MATGAPLARPDPPRHTPAPVPWALDPIRASSAMILRLIALAWASAGCWSPAPRWSEGDFERIHTLALESLRQELGLDTLTVDPRPRFLVEEGGSVRMGDFSAFGDPVFDRALRVSPVVLPCRREPEGPCSPARYPRLATLSEVLPLGSRDAAVMAAYVDLTREPITGREVVIRLRFGAGGWQVVTVADGVVMSTGGPPAH